MSDRPEHEDPPVHNSLKDLAKARGARYTLLNFGSDRRGKPTVESSLGPVTPPQATSGFREPRLVWAGKETLQCQEENIHGAKRSVSRSDAPSPASVNLSFPFGAIFLCIALLVLHAFPDETSVALTSALGQAGQGEEMRTLSAPNMTIPLIVFGFTAVLAAGYFLAWATRAVRKLFRFVRG